jgi:hypothetical protein
MLLVRDSGSETEVDRSEVEVDKVDEPQAPQAPMDDYDEVQDEFERPEAEEQEAEQQHGASVPGCTREMEEEEELAREAEAPPATSSKAAGMPPSAKPSSPTCELNRGPQNLRL